jgi:hypothetical protein
MRRAGFGWAFTAALVVLVGCNNSNTPADSGNPGDSGSNNNDSGTNTDGGTGGTITTASSGNKLPAAWPAHASDLVSDNSGNAKNWINQLVQLSDPSVIVLGGAGQCGAAGYPSCNTCPTPFIQFGSKNYCNGFSVDAGAGTPTVYADDYSYTSSTSSCSTLIGTAGAALASVRGIWNDYYSKGDPDAGVPKSDTYSIALTQCSDVTGTGAYVGTTTPRAGTVASTLAGNPANGSTVTVTGVVVAAWSAGGGAEFGFALEDYAGGANSGLAVGKSSSSASTATPAAIGDDVTVTGTINYSFGSWKIDL